MSYSDSLGKAHESPAGGEIPRGWTSQPLVGESTSVLVFWPGAATADLLAAVAAAPSWREGVHTAGPVPVAVLIVPPHDDDPLSHWEATTVSLLETLGIARGKYSMSFDAGWGGRTRPLELPLDIVIVGTRVPSLEEFAESIAHGIHVERMTLRRFRATMPPVDVLVTTAGIGRSLLDERRWRTPPSLVIIENYERRFDLRPEAVPDGTSIVGLPFGAAQGSHEMIEGIVAGVVHDLPLHEAVLAAGRAMALDPETRQRVRVVTSATGLEQLRLDPVFEAVQERVRQYVRYRGMEGITRTLGMRGIDAAAPDVDLATVDRAVDHAASLVRDFTQESRGLTPIAIASESLTKAEGAVDYVQSVADSITADPVLLDRLEQNQHRRATVWVSEASGSIQGLDPALTLARDTEYALHVGVGIRWDHDLVPPSAPPLDPILPPTDAETYPVMVSIFSDTATFPGSTSELLEVARVGPCGPITFPFRTPERGARTRIRVILYYRRHLLQVFNVEAQLADWPTRPRRGRGLRLEVLFSRAEQLTAMDATFDERALAIATNEDPGGMHRLMFDTGDGIPFDEKALGALQKTYRGRLLRAYGEQRNAKLSDRQLRRFLTEMAVLGRQLWDHLYTEASDELKDVLVAISQSQEPLTIQHLRVQPTFAFPWGAVYDWNVPASEDARAKARICVGDAAGTPCACAGETADVICARGFWGLRHVIEEFVRSDDVDKPVKEVTHASGAPPVACTLGVADKWSTDLVTRLQKQFATAVFRLGSGDSLYQRLRDEDSRPTVLVVIGHLSNRPERNAPDPPRVSIEAAERYLYPRALVDERKRGRWQEPCRPVVMLLACGSAADELGKITSGFVARLASMGASAVVATEERIDTSLAADLAEWTIARLPRSGPGESLRTWRCKLLSASNPCGFLFSCFGNAHVTQPSLPAPA